MRIAASLLVLLAGCTPAQEQCQRAATAELRTVTALIAETRQNLARGYAIRTETEPLPPLTICTGTGEADGFRTALCTSAGTREVETPEAIDPAAEQRKLDRLIKRRGELEPAARAALARCAAGTASDPGP